MDDLSSCAPEGQPFASKKNCAGHEPHELPGRDMIPREKRKGRKPDQWNPRRPEFKERRLLSRRFTKTAVERPPLLEAAANVITIAMSCDPAMASITDVVHAWLSRIFNKRPC